jgi:TrmH family RNA methyltransferase
MTPAPKPITSLQNERVKAIRALEMRKVRKETGLFVAEGASILITARDRGFRPETLVYRAGSVTGAAPRGLVDWALKAGAEVLEVSEAVLGKLASKDNPQSMLAVFRQRWVELPDPKTVKGTDVWVALEEVRDPGNLGTIIRTADAAGLAGVALVGASCDPFGLEAVRATMGSIFHVPLARTSEDGLIAQAKRHGARLVGTHLTAAAIDYREADYSTPLILLMGNEQQGLTERLAAACDTLVRIPMRGKADSLNLAVSTGLMIYEALRSEIGQASG